MRTRGSKKQKILARHTYMAPNSNPLLLHLVCSAVAHLIPSLSRFRHASNHPQFGDDAQTHALQKPFKHRSVGREAIRVAALQ